MADQTSAFITATDLGDPDVLGWSMGSMIAQALAIRHPGQVHRLILCATYPGVGNAVHPSQKDVDALTGNDPAAAQADLFPADQSMAADAFDGSIAAYPPKAPAPGSVIAAQRAAILSWFDGRDPSGRRADQIAAPTLVTDGADDRIDAETNDREVSTEIAGSRLVLYPDAGHAFLFQEGESFAFEVRSFLDGAPKPINQSQIRTRYLAAYKKSVKSGAKWVAGLKSLTSASSAQELARIDVAEADSDSAFDDALLGYGATGTLGANIDAVSNADELIARDVLALGAQSAASTKKWTATIKDDGKVVVAAEDTLRRQLGLAPLSTTTTTVPSTTTTLNL